MTRIPYTLFEKVTVLVMSLVEAASVGSLPVDLFWILTSPQSEFGMGLLLTAGITQLAAVLLSVAAVVIFALVMGFFWLHHAHKAKKYEARINKALAEQETFLKDMLRYYNELSLDARTEFLTQLKKKYPGVDEASFTNLAQKINSSDYDSSNITTTLFVIQSSDIKNVSYRPAIGVGVLTGLTTGSSLFGMFWGGISVVGSWLPLVGALAAIPFMGWIIVGAAALLAIGIGCMWAYYTHKNSCRKANAATLGRVNHRVSKELGTIKEEVNKAQHLSSARIQQSLIPPPTNVVLLQPSASASVDSVPTQLPSSVGSSADSVASQDFSGSSQDVLTVPVSTATESNTSSNTSSASSYGSAGRRRRAATTSDAPLPLFGNKQVISADTLVGHNKQAINDAAAVVIEEAAHVSSPFSPQ